MEKERGFLERQSIQSTGLGMQVEMLSKKLDAPGWDSLEKRLYKSLGVLKSQPQIDWITYVNMVDKKHALGL